MRYFKRTKPEIFSIFKASDADLNFRLRFREPYSRKSTSGRTVRVHNKGVISTIDIDFNVLSDDRLLLAKTQNASLFMFVNSFAT